MKDSALKKLEKQELGELKVLEKKEQEVKKMTEQIEEVEKVIEKQEDKILSVEEDILAKIQTNPVRTLAVNGFTRKELHILKKVFVYRIAKHKFLFTVLVTLGVVLVWRGVWELTASVPIMSSSVVALLIGLIILWIINKYTDVA